MLTDEEIRRLAVDLFTAKTDRDRQTRIGASDLSDQCDFCLAAKLLGQPRESAIGDRTWLGRVLGTALDDLLTGRAGSAEGSETQKHVWFADLEGYGRVGGSIDLCLPDQIVDWKGSTRKKSALMQDYLQTVSPFRAGLPPRWTKQARGNYKLDLGSGAAISLSERDYQAEMAKQVYKVNGYFAQTNLYMRGSGRQRASLVFVNRDGTGFWDVPTFTGWDDEAKVHDVWVLSFDYDEKYTDAVIARGQAIWNMLAEGSTLDTFQRHEHCFLCSKDLEDERKAAMPDLEVEWPTNI